MGRGLHGRGGDRARGRAARLPHLAPGGVVGGALHGRARDPRVPWLLRAAHRRGAGGERARGATVRVPRCRLGVRALRAPRAPALDRPRACGRHRGAVRPAGAGRPGVDHLHDRHGGRPQRRHAHAPELPHEPLRSQPLAAADRRRPVPERAAALPRARVHVRVPGASLPRVHRDLRPLAQAQGHHRDDARDRHHGHARCSHALRAPQGRPRAARPRRLAIAAPQ